MPVTLCIYTAEECLESDLRFFLLLKFLYPEGKIRNSKIDLEAIRQISGYSTNSYLKHKISQLITLRWLKWNNKTGYFLINSFEQIRTQNHWPQRSGVRVKFNDLNKLNSIIGGALYGYLYHDFWRKFRRDKVVRIKGRTFNSLPAYLHEFGKYAPVATTGVNSIYDISQSKASRLKHDAALSGLIEVKKYYLETNLNADEVRSIRKHDPESKNLVIKKGKVYLQLVDLILPRFEFKKRKKLGT